jgi:hypothetical protein
MVARLFGTQLSKLRVIAPAGDLLHREIATAQFERNSGVPPLLNPVSNRGQSVRDAFSGLSPRIDAPPPPGTAQRESAPLWNSEMSEMRV